MKPSHTCTLDTQLRGCISYSKCQAASLNHDPAPAALYDYCSGDRYAADPANCKDACRIAQCCTTSPRSCVAQELGMCLDYAACQNRRASVTLPVAPGNLDQLCFQGDPLCDMHCAAATCCNNNNATSGSGGSGNNNATTGGVNATGSCMKDNFITCLTYAACSYSNRTHTNVTVPPQFNYVAKPPNDILFACDPRAMSSSTTSTGGSTYTGQSCQSLCYAADCCKAVGSANCFNLDPLGCLAWEAQCQNIPTYY
jgi:hypothetical protein